MKHHTKQKGDIGVLKAQCDLVEQGFMVLVPLTEHAPFDLVVYKDCKFLRVQVRYCSVLNGRIVVRFRTSWTDRHGTHTLLTDKRHVDRYCLYCPDTDLCYYVDPVLFNQGVTLRLTLPGNKHRSPRMARDFRLCIV